MTVTNIKQQVKRAGRYSITVDGKFAFGMSEAALLDSGLHVGKELSDQEFKDLKKTAGLDKIYGASLRFAAMRPRSRWEIASYLQRKDADPEQAEQIIQRLEKTGLVDDYKFARSWVESRRLIKPTSVRKLRLELRQKQVASDIIDSVLAEDSTTDIDTLRQLIAKKRSRYPDQNKLMQYLARQGYGYDDIKNAISDEIPKL